MSIIKNFARSAGEIATRVWGNPVNAGLGTAVVTTNAAFAAVGVCDHFNAGGPLTGASFLAALISPLLLGAATHVKAAKALDAQWRAQRPDAPEAWATPPQPKEPTAAQMRAVGAYVV
jgi:hypothetical protein